MSERLRRLAQRISDELNDLERVVRRAKEGWNRTQQSGDDLYLDGYRGFRHIVRNIYTFRFDFAKMQQLVEAAPTVFARVREELLAFAAFLEQSAQIAKEQ